MARINPSPDWFVGVDSFQLCIEGNWVDAVSVELDPLDGGTDNGFTFTAANWPTKPQGIAYRITSRYPPHPAGSFYYPNLFRLPRIATLTFTKNNFKIFFLREYTLTESYHEDEVEVEFVSNDNLQANSEAPRGIDPNRDLNEAIAEERREMDTSRYRRYRPLHPFCLLPSPARRYWSTTGSGQQVVTDIPRDNKAAIINSIATSYALQRPRYTATAIPRTSKAVVDGKTRYSETGKSDWPYYQTYRQTAETQKAQIYEDIQRKIANVSNVSSMGYSFVNNVTNLADQRQHRFRMKHHGLTSKGKRIRTRAPRDCKIGEWGPWSACSRSCGVGETQRTRKVTIKPRRGGAPCPPLKETKWCGSVNPCSENKPIVDYHWHAAYWSLILVWLDDVRREFTFKPSLRIYAEKVLKRVAEKFNLSSPTYVSVHVRRTDYVDYLWQKLKTRPAPVSYYLSAMDYFAGKYNNVIFVVTSDNIAWCKYNLRSKRHRISFVSENDGKGPGKDLAVLSACNHSIIDYGTYGSFGAILAAGETVVYNVTTYFSTLIADVLPNWRIMS
ncbi:Galactoside 2-alpha-L-fucosyltransferase 1 [Cyphomyrmex costatus]|uniref:Galactoside 2-alpha-L-fucosyltransferase 1 n=1 Tax=Cyphomyrmex costatus TaxID=456900 RepID=A0A151ILS1_9HYME|nr:Galactoside 2-alpha-L-fucosyltransferase 1 [Cyphomyrmex costatus]